MGNSKTAGPGIHQHLIVGGTIKAATSSLFNYLGAHPQICGSKVKETYFFSQDYSGLPEVDYEKYASFFSPGPTSTVLMEASPNYLAYKENIAPRIRRLIPEVKLLFVLRNPVDRLYSHFHFARGKLQLPQGLSFEDFIELCKRFDNEEITSDQAGIVETHLRALQIGSYGHYLGNYYETFAAENIRVVFYDDLASNPVQVLADICGFIGVSPTFYDDFALHRANVTFSARLKFLHYFVLWFNRVLEPVLRKSPAVKRRLSNIYKAINRDRQEITPMRDETREKLVDYYAPSNGKVKQLLHGRSFPPWLEQESSGRC